MAYEEINNHDLVMEPSVTVSITFFNTAKQTWEALQEKCP